MMNYSSTRRHGLTLVELLTVVAIIGIVVALSLPAVLSVRRAVRRLQCQNNLHQLGIALNGHESARRRFPSGAANEWSWIARILPFIEEDCLYEQLDFTLDPFIPPNDLYSHEVMPILLCPEDELSPQVHIAHSGAAQQMFGHTNYLGTLDSGPSRGMFSTKKGVRMREVLDGAAKTVMVGERPVVDDNGHTHGWWVWGITSDTYLSTNTGLRYGSNTEHASAYHFWSHHAGGANFVFVDGAVRLLAYDIEPSVFQALCTKDGRDSIGSFE